MSMKHLGTLAFVTLTCAIAVPAAAQPPTDDDRAAIERMLAGESQIQGAALDRAIAAAAAHPLGARENPVRAAGPGGQRAYLSRLRCANGAAPRFERIGNFGVGVYGNIIDGYEVTCEGSQAFQVTIHMDMYHRGHVEPRAVPGFTIAGAPGAGPSPTI